MYSSYSPATVSRLVSAQCTVHSCGTLFSAALAKAAEADSRTAVRRGRQECTVATHRGTRVLRTTYVLSPATDNATPPIAVHSLTHSLCTL